MKYGVISLVLCISTRLQLVTILTLLVKYLVIFNADPCNKSYVCGPKKNMNRTLAIDSSFQTFTVGLLVKFIDYLYHCFLQKRFPRRVSAVPSVLLVSHFSQAVTLSDLISILPRSRTADAWVISRACGQVMVYGKENGRLS